MLPKKVLISLFWAITQAAQDPDLATTGAWPELDDTTIPLRQNINKLSSEAGPQWCAFTPLIILYRTAPLTLSFPAGTFTSKH